MYQIAICDDEKIFAEYLKKMLQEILHQFGINYEVTVYSEGSQLIKALDKNPEKFHLLILDILLNNTNGISLAKKLRKNGNNISILFVTCSKEFSLEGYEINPIHYLIKPVQKERLAVIIEKEYKKSFLPKHIIVNSKYQKQAIPMYNILYIERLNRKVIVHTKENEIEHIGTLKDFLPLLPSQMFIRCHKSFVVNASKVISVSRLNFVLEGKIEVPVGRAYYKDAMSSILSYLDSE